MVRPLKLLFAFTILLILGACASRMKDQMEAYRKAFAAGNFEEANGILEKSDLKSDEKSKLLWLLEKGTLSLAMSDETEAIAHFSEAIELIDRLYTKQLGASAASFLINDASDVFYGASYERSYAHYFLVRSYYSRYLKTQNKSDLQGARATILAWDTYFSDLQRSAPTKTIYQTDLMMKVFGGIVHEISEIQNDKQISLQLYKDALRILDTMGGAFSAFNSSSKEYIAAYQEALSKEKEPPSKLYIQTPLYHDFKNFLHFKVLSLTKEIRGFDYQVQLKALRPSPDVLKKIEAGKGNVVVLLEDGLIPKKAPRPFNFGLKGAMGSVENSGAKAFIAGAGADFVATFAMTKLGMAPGKFDSAGGFAFAHTATKLAVTEAAIQFELPVIEDAPKTERYGVVIHDDKGAVVEEAPLCLISENGDIAKVVMEEDVVSRYVKTGTRIAVKHILAIVAAIQVYRQLRKGDQGGDFIAKAAAMATYVGAAKGISVLEKADVRHWTTLPRAFRMNEFKLAPGTYQLSLASYEGDKIRSSGLKLLGSFVVNDSGKSVQTFKINQL